MNITRKKIGKVPLTQKSTQKLSGIFQEVANGRIPVQESDDIVLESFYRVEHPSSLDQPLEFS